MWNSFSILNFNIAIDKCQNKYMKITIQNELSYNNFILMTFRFTLPFELKLFVNNYKKKKKIIYNLLNLDVVFTTLLVVSGAADGEEEAVSLWITA